MCSFAHSSPTMTECAFTGNTGLYAGGGMYSFGNNSNPVLANCTFTGNAAGEFAGGGMYNYGNSPTLTNCTFTNNNAAEYGGGMYNSNSDNLTLTACVLTKNNCLISGGGIRNFQCVPLFVEMRVCGNSPNQVDGDFTDGGGNTIADQCPPDCPDINGDGYVNVTDLLAVIAAWGIDCDGCPEDVNNDANVNVTDLLIVIGNWGPCE